MKKKICTILIAVLVAVLGASTYFIIEHYKEANKQAELYDELADLVEAAVQTDSATEPTEQIPYSEEKMLLPELAGLYQQNGDLVGWISIADTNINYPVMQSVYEPNFYLKHGFDKDYSDYGCPYVQEDCDVQKPSDNLVIYGHHMANGSMFHNLEKFKDKDFWSGHMTITFNTLTDKQECPKCLNDYIHNPDYIVRRLDPFAKRKDRCDKCDGDGWDYVVTDRYSSKKEKRGSNDRK